MPVLGMFNAVLVTFNAVLGTFNVVLGMFNPWGCVCFFAFHRPSPAVASMKNGHDKAAAAELPAKRGGAGPFREF